MTVSTALQQGRDSINLKLTSCSWQPHCGPKHSSPGLPHTEHCPHISAMSLWMNHLYSRKLSTVFSKSIFQNTLHPELLFLTISSFIFLQSWNYALLGYYFPWNFLNKELFTLPGWRKGPYSGFPPSCHLQATNHVILLPPSISSSAILHLIWFYKIPSYPTLVHSWYEPVTNFLLML